MSVNGRAADSRVLGYVCVRDERGPKIDEQAPRCSEYRLAAPLETWVGLGGHRGIL